MIKEKKIYFKNSKGQKLCGILQTPEGKGPFPAIVLVHGFGGGTHEVKNIHMCKELAKAGFIALRFDFYNKPNGCSEPKIEEMTISQQIDGTKCAIDFIESLSYVDKARIGLTGHSLGGMTVVLYTPKDNRIKALVVQSAVSEWGKSRALSEFNSEKWKRKGYVQFDKSWGKMNVNLGFYDDGAKYDVYKTAEKIKCPTLIFHGDKDEAVDFKQSKELIKHINKGELKIIKDADHCYYDNNTLPIATKLMIDWFKRYLT